MDLLVYGPFPKPLPSKITVIRSRKEAEKNNASEPRIGDHEIDESEHRNNSSATHLLSNSRINDLSFAWDRGSAVFENGKAVLWGYGIPTMTSTVEFPSSISDLTSTSTRVSKVACGSTSTIFLTEEGVVYEMKLSPSKSNTTAPLPVLITEKIELDVTIESIVSGFEHHLAVDSGGGLWGWGSNKYGQLGKEKDLTPKGTDIITHPIQITLPHHVSASQLQCQVEKVVAGSYHTLVLMTDGKVYGMGWNGYFQVNAKPPNLKRKRAGFDNEIQKKKKTGRCDMEVSSSQKNDFCCDDVLSGDNDNEALSMLEIGEIESQNLGTEREIEDEEGKNELDNDDGYGLGGMGVDVYQPTYISIPRWEEDGILDKVMDIAAGGWHSLFLTKRGVVYCLGWGEWGQGGTGSTEASMIPSPLLSLYQQAGRMVRIWAGARHSLALGGIMENSTLYFWGFNKFLRFPVSIKDLSHSLSDNSALPMTECMKKNQIMEMKYSGECANCLLPVAVPLPHKFSCVLSSHTSYIISCTRWGFVIGIPNWDLVRNYSV